MAANNRLVIAVVVVALAVAGFWFMLLAPKREESAALTTKIDGVQAKVDAARQQADAAAEAKSGFPDDYEQLVLLGKAVPGDDDTASFLVQIDEVAREAGVEFRSLELADGAGGAEVPAPTPVPAPTTPAPTDGSTPAAAPVAPATEATAATLPIGATIGPAGLPIMPYTLEFRGEFFEVADFIKNLDALVQTTNGRLAADGRLVTIDGFALEADGVDGFPLLSASFAVTTYLAPAGQGLTAGATPVAPAPATSPTTPVATTP
jgi:hypothetical protein